MRPNATAAIALAVIASLVCLPEGVQAEETSVPASVQVALLAKLASYDKNFEARSGERAHILIVAVKDDSDSIRASGQLKAAFSEADRIGGLPHDEAVVDFVDPPTLAKRCREENASVLYIMPGLAREVEAIGKALEGINVLSVGAVSGYAAKGAVLDFFVEGGRPRIAVNLERAKAQGVAFAPELLRITRVIE